VSPPDRVALSAAGNGFEFAEHAFLPLTSPWVSSPSSSSPSPMYVEDHMYLQPPRSPRGFLNQLAGFERVQPASVSVAQSEVARSLTSAERLRLASTPPSSDQDFETRETHKAAPSAGSNNKVVVRKQDSSPRPKKYRSTTLAVMFPCALTQTMFLSSIGGSSLRKRTGR